MKVQEDKIKACTFCSNKYNTHLAENLWWPAPSGEKSMPSKIVVTFSGIVGKIYDEFNKLKHWYVILCALTCLWWDNLTQGSIWVLKLIPWNNSEIKEVLANGKYY